MFLLAERGFQGVPFLLDRDTLGHCLLQFFFRRLLRRDELVFESLLLFRQLGERGGARGGFRFQRALQGTNFLRQTSHPLIRLCLHGLLLGRGVSLGGGDRGVAVRLRGGEGLFHPRFGVLTRGFPHSQELCLRGFERRDQLGARGFARREKRVFSRRDLGAGAFQSLRGFGARRVFRCVTPRLCLGTRSLGFRGEVVGTRLEPRRLRRGALLHRRELGFHLGDAFLQICIRLVRFGNVRFQGGERRLRFARLRFSRSAFLRLCHQVRSSPCEVNSQRLRLRLERRVLDFARGSPELRLQILDRALELHTPRNVVVQRRVFHREFRAGAFAGRRERRLRRGERGGEGFLRRFLLLFVRLSLRGKRRV